MLLLLLLACPAPDDTGSSDDSDPTEVDTELDTGDPVVWETVLDVGDGFELSHPNDVPWESLGPSTLVRIHNGTYAAKWVINTTGPLRVEGVGSVIIDGDGATTRTGLDYWNESRSVLKIGGSSIGPDVATDITIANLTFRGAMQDNTFVNDATETETYADNAACIHVEVGFGVKLVGNTLTDCGNGLFIGNQSGDIEVHGNHLYGNGVVGSAYEHNSYTEANGIDFAWNRYGRLREGADGNNLKDRSAGLRVRYNWIEGGNRQLDLVESSVLDQSDAVCVVGNVLIEGEGDGNSQIVHYGGDNGNVYRSGPLVLVHNTVVSTRQGNTTWLRLSTPENSALAYDNVVVANSLAITAGAGQVTLVDNGLPSGWKTTFEAEFNGSLSDEGTLVADPQLDENHAPGAGSPLVGAAGDLGEHCTDVDLQYVQHQQASERAGRSTIGAFEGP